MPTLIENLVIANPKISDLAVLTAGTMFSGELPLENILNVQPSTVARSNTESGYFEADLGSDKPVRLIWLGYTNATSTATWRVRGATVQGNLVSAPDYDSTSLSIWRGEDLSTWNRVHAFLFLDAATALRYWRIDFDNVGAGFIDIGRLYLVDPWQPRRNHDERWNIQLIDDSRSIRSFNGAPYTNVLGKYRQLNFTLSYFTEDEMMADAFLIDREITGSKDLLVLRNPKEPRYLMDQAIYGMFQRLTPIQHLTLNLYRKTYRIQEYELP